jgi:hypothetical protein
MQVVGLQECRNWPAHLGLGFVSVIVWQVMDRAKLFLWWSWEESARCLRYASLQCLSEAEGDWPPAKLLHVAWKSIQTDVPC